MTRHKFDVTKPRTKEEKLIVGLTTELDKTTMAYVKKHNPGNLTQEMFLMLRDATLAYIGSMLFDLVSSLAHREQIDLFLDECKTIFECYINDIKKRYAVHH